MPPGASMPANSAVMIPVRNASWVSTNIATSSAAAAKGIAKFQMVGSLNGACIRAATLSPNVKPTLISAVWTRIAEPTSANAFCLLKLSALPLLLCSANFQAAQ